MSLQVVADGPGDAIAQFHVFLHFGPAQIHIAVAQADVVLDILIVQLERRRLRLVQHLDGAP